MKARDIKLESLPQYSKKKVAYLKQSASFVVAWLEDYLAELFNQKTTFLGDYIQDIVPSSFNLEYDEEKKQVRAILNFSITDEEEDEEETELVLVGQVHRSEKNEVGIDWQRVSGNAYWLAAVENSLNESLQSLAWCMKACHQL